MRLKGIEIAKQMLGLQEIRDNKKIRDFLKLHAVHGDIDIDPGKIAWCAAIMNAWERASGGLPDGKLNARSFLNYGSKIDLKDAQEGDIVIFKRGNSTWQGHVAYFVNYDKSQNIINCLGGNQANRICIAGYIEDRLLGIRRG